MSKPRWTKTSPAYPAGYRAEVNGVACKAWREQVFLARRTVWRWFVMVAGAPLMLDDGPLGWRRQFRTLAEAKAEAERVAMGRKP